MEMTSHESFVEALRGQGVKYGYGIVGSAFMPGLDVFERGGIRFVDVAHEQGAAPECTWPCSHPPHSCGWDPS